MRKPRVKHLSIVQKKDIIEKLNCFIDHIKSTYPEYEFDLENYGVCTLVSNAESVAFILKMDVKEAEDDEE